MHGEPESPPRPNDVERAVEALRRGRLVALPTETVYGLGADAENPDAVRRIFVVKGRPPGHPLIVHGADAAVLDRFARKVPAGARKLAERFWPGPLTLVLPRAPRVPDAVTGGLDTVGLRVPDHPLTRQVLALFGGGIAAPSANRFGRVSPTRAEHVRSELGADVEVVLDGGPCRVGVESTIVSLAGERPLLLRPGAILAAEVAEVLGDEVLPPAPGATAPRAPGTLASHYAPATPLELVTGRALQARIEALRGANRKVAVLARQAAFALPPDVSWRAAPGSAEAYARDLYDTLRALDAAGADLILVEEVPEDAPWVAIADRLRRAAGGAAGTRS